MEKIVTSVKTRKRLSFETAQLLYGASIFLTFGVVSQIALRL